MRGIRLKRVLLATCLCAGAVSVMAQERADPLRFVTWPVQDAVGIVSGVSTSELLGMAGAGAALLALSRYDASLTDRTAGVTSGMHVRIVEEFGNVKVVRPLGMALFTGALLSGDRRFQDAAFTSLQAVVVSNLITNSLKSVFGRARPYQDVGPGRFHPFSGDRSFPSGHSTTAFAFLAPWYFYYPGPETAGLLVLATATSFSRMATEQHWFTDVLAGSAVGFVTAFVLTRRHLGRTGTRIIPRLGPDGVALELPILMAISGLWLHVPGDP